MVAMQPLQESKVAAREDQFLNRTTYDKIFEGKNEDLDRNLDFKYEKNLFFNQANTRTYPP